MVLFFCMKQSGFPALSEILTQDFRMRLARNRTYSIRAYARYLTVSPSTLLSLMNGKSGGSRSILKRLSKRLSLGEKDCSYLLKVAELNRTKDSTKRKILRHEITRIDSNFNLISDQVFYRLGYWQCFAVMELIKTVNARTEPSWIAKKLGISETQAEDSLKALTAAEIIEIGPGGKLKILRDFISLPSGPKLDLARNFHGALIDKGKASLFDQPAENRNISSVVLRFRTSDRDQVDEFIKDFRRRFAANFEEGENHDAVYALGIQFFRLDRDGEDRSST